MKIKDIHINPKNPRYIKDDRFRLLVKNIKEFPKMMKLRPIIIDNTGMILGGNMRYLAMVDLGYKEIPEGWVIKASELSEEEKEKFKILDNVPFGNWDYDILANEWDIAKLQEWGIELPEIEANIEAEEDDFDVDKAVETAKEPTSKLGEIWQLGEHRLMCGDAKLRGDVEELIQGEKADVGITDPPYGVRKKEEWDSKDNFIKSLLVWFNNYRKFCNYGLIWFCADKMLPYLVNYEGFVRLLIWNKPPGSQYAGASNNNIWYSNESILVYDYSELKKNCGTEKYSYSVFESRTISEGEEGHPTTKPIDLMSWLISHYSKKNQIVLDLFGGSGSTLIACEQLDRKCFMMEVDPIYCDVIIKRWETYTNGKAVLIK